MRETTGAVVVGVTGAVLLSIIGLIVVGISRLVLLVGVLEAVADRAGLRVIRAMRELLELPGLVHRH